MHQFSRQPQPRLADSHHDLLSCPKKAEAPLLSHLRAASQPLSPLEVLTEEPLPSQSLLNHVRVEPAMPAPAAPVIAKTVVLGEPARLSECMLWQIQENFYKSQGIAAWEQNVPLFITSNAFIAEQYADMVVAFLLDCADHLDATEPVYIVELATGTGRFSMHMLNELSRKLTRYSALSHLQVRYVMTDFAEANVAFWMDHEKLRPHVESGLLDFAVYRPDTMQTLDLCVRGETVSAGTVKNPVVAIANYFFDSIPVDLFRVENKKLSEGQVTLVRNLEGVDPASEIHISEVLTRYTYREVYSDNYYPDARWNEVLRWYRHNVKKGTLLFPVGALQVLHNLETLANGQLMLISSDKAYTDLEHMCQFSEHHFAIHGGAFSYMVNYDAIGRYFENAGGTYLKTGCRNVTLNTICCVRVNDPAVRLENLGYLYEERINRSMPITSIFETQAPLYAEGTFSPRQIIDMHLGYLRLSNCDPKILTVAAPKLLDLIPEFNATQESELVLLMERVWDNFYFYKGEPNLPFWMAQIYFHLGRLEDSIRLFEATVRYFGEHPALCFLTAQCHERLGHRAQALEFYQQALALDPNFEEARAALEAMLAAR